MLAKEPKDLKCKSGNPILRMCTNSKCQKLSLICGDEECATCNEDDHEECTLTKVKNLVKMINKNVNNRKDCMTRLTEIDNQFAVKLKQSFSPLIKDSWKKGFKDG